MFESKSLSRLNEALHAVVELGPTLREMVDEIRAMREVMVETNAALGEVSTSLERTRAQLEIMAGDVTAAADIIDRAHSDLQEAARQQGV